MSFCSHQKSLPSTWHPQYHSHLHDGSVDENVETPNYDVVNFNNGHQEYLNFPCEDYSFTASTLEGYVFGHPPLLNRAAHPAKSRARPGAGHHFPDDTDFHSPIYQNIENLEIITSNSNDEDEYHDDDSRGTSQLLSTEEKDRRRRRRERNKVAATKCRHKKKEHVIQLNIESQTLESNNTNLKIELRQLQQERNHLIMLLENHRQACVKNIL